MGMVQQGALMPSPEHLTWHEPAELTYDSSNKEQTAAGNVDGLTLGGMLHEG